MKDNANSSYSFLSGFESWDHLKRFSVVVTVISTMILIILSFTLIFGNFSLKSNVISFQIGKGEVLEKSIKEISLKEYGLVIKMDDGTVFANAIVPANKLWVDTGIVVKPGSKLEILASGSVNLATQLSNDLARDPSKFDLSSFNFLFDFEGKPLNKRATQAREADKIRKNLSIEPTANLGQLLATVTDRPINRGNPRMENTQVISKEKNHFEYDSNMGVNGNLYLTVNDLIASASKNDKDVWLLKTDGQEYFSDEQARSNIIQAYLDESVPLLDPNVNAKIKEIEDRWDYIVSNRYWEAFLEDNSGYFAVSIKMTPP